MANLIRVIVALNLPKKVPELIKKGRVVLDALDNNASFPTLLPPLPVVKTHVDELETAETDAQTGTQGLIQIRNEKKVVVVKDLHALKGCVQAEVDAHPEHARAMIASAGMDAVERMPRQKQIFEVRLGDLSGQAILIGVVAGQRSSYHWQWSTDQITWISAPTTTQATTLIQGLTPGKTYYFRFKAVTPKGERDWSQIVNLLVR